VTDRFGHFCAIDWSGAAGERHKGIAVALCGAGDHPPALVRPGHRWSRPEILDWLLHDLPDDTLVGLDLGMSLPFEDCDGFFPGWDASPPDAKSLWTLVDMICAAEDHLGASALVSDEIASRYFRRQGGLVGQHFHLPGAAHKRGRFRVTEHRQAAMGCQPCSNFNLIGAAQVGKSSLTGMRVLHHLAGRIPVWPFDPLPPSGSVLVEIYTTIAALAAGRRPGRSKLRSVEDLNHALAVLGSAPVPGSGAIDDHSADALITSAWLRRNAGRKDLWQPAALSPHIARTEGWTFGAL